MKRSRFRELRLKFRAIGCSMKSEGGRIVIYGYAGRAWSVLCRANNLDEAAAFLSVRRELRPAQSVKMPRLNFAR
jgi:hypothetical protein